MWKKLDDAVGVQPDLAAKDTPDVAALGDALVQSLMNDPFKKKDFAVVPQKALPDDLNQPLPSPSLKAYTEAMNEFTRNATAFIEQLPLLSKARAAYEEAMRASAEMRKVLDAGDESLQSLMTQLEQGVNVHGIKPVPDKKTSEPAKVEKMRVPDQTGTRPIRWP